MNLSKTVKARRGIFDNLNQEQINLIDKTILKNPYIKQTPTHKQRDAIVLQHKELLFGGAAGGGKSSLLLIGALQYVHLKETHSLILRRTNPQLEMADALIPRAHSWLSDTDAEWREGKKTWTFPNGSTLKFGHMENEVDKYNYQGAAFDFIGFDELTQFGESQYLYLFSRLGRMPGVPARIWSASNPGGIGHEWVKRRFIVPDYNFIPSFLSDNPYLDTGYCDNLAMLDPVTRAQLQYGDWDVALQGNLFKRDMFKYSDQIPYGSVNTRVVRYWDCAGTEKKKGLDPDWTVGLKLLVKGGEYWICDIVRGQWNPYEVKEQQRITALADGQSVSIYEEQEPGSSGKAVIDDKARTIFQGYSYHGIRATGSKVDRAKGVSSAVANGLVNIPSNVSWSDEFLHEVVAFPEGVHDDQVDALSGAYNQIAGGLGDPDRFNVISSGSYGR